MGQFEIVESGIARAILSLPADEISAVPGWVQVCSVQVSSVTNSNESSPGKSGGIWLLEGRVGLRSRIALVVKAEASLGNRITETQSPESSVVTHIRIELTQRRTLSP